MIWIIDVIIIVFFINTNSLLTFTTENKKNVSFKSSIQGLKKNLNSITGGGPVLNISFSPESRLKLIEIPSNDDDNKNQESKFIPVYENGSTVSGHVDIILPDGFNDYEYDEIAIYLVGHVVCDDIDQDQVFLSHKISVTSKPGKLTKNVEFNFNFKPKLILNSFYGSLFKCRYFIRAIINRSKMFQSNIKTDQDFMVCNIHPLDPPKSISMQVGVMIVSILNFNIIM